LGWIAFILLAPLQNCLAQGVSWELMDDLDREVSGSEQPQPQDGADQTLNRAPSPPLHNSILRSGVSEAELIEILGEPDFAEVGIGSNKTWRYGKSVVFLVDSKVSGWSDGGDLEDRVRFGLDLRPAKPSYVRFPDEWLNAWKRTPVPSRADAVDELLQQ